MKNTLPDNRGNRDTRAAAGTDDIGRAAPAGWVPVHARRVAAAPPGRQRGIGPLICLAMAIALATHALVPCLAAAGLAGTAALLAATMAALFATLLAIVSFSVAAAIATMLCSPVAAATQDTAFSPPLRTTALARASPSGAVARADGGVIAAILPCCGGNRLSARAGALPNGAAPPAATLTPLSREPHETA